MSNDESITIHILTEQANWLKTHPHFNLDNLIQKAFKEYIAHEHIIKTHMQLEKNSEIFALVRNRLVHQDDVDSIATDIMSLADVDLKYAKDYVRRVKYKLEFSYL